MVAGGYLGLADMSALPSWQTLGQFKDPVSKKQGEPHLKKNTWGWPLNEWIGTHTFLKFIFSSARFLKKFNIL